MVLFTVLMGIQVVWLLMAHGSHYDGFPAAALLLSIPWRLRKRSLPHTAATGSACRPARSNATIGEL